MALPVKKYRLLAALAALTLLAACATKLYIERQPPLTPTPGNPAALQTYPPDYTPNYSQVEENLYIGARTDTPPPNTQAVLSLSYTKDLYTAPLHQYSSIPDGQPAPSLDWLKAQVLFIDTQQKARRLTYVHCDAGCSRSALVTAAYLMYEHHWTRDTALAYLKQKRPVIAPNIYFQSLLLDYETTLQNP